MIEPGEQVLAKEAGRLSATAPFDCMRPGRLVELLADAEVVFFRHGKVIYHPEIAESATKIWLVRLGSVRFAEVRTDNYSATAEELLEFGSMFPLESALTGHPAWSSYTAAEDCFLWEFGGSALERLLAEPAVLRWIGLHLQNINGGLRDRVAGLLRSRQAADQALALPALSAGREGLLCVPGETPIRGVAALMAEKEVGSVIVGSPEVIVGIVTQTDLIRRAMAEGRDSASPINEIMTANPQMVDSTATVLDVGIEMARLGFRHLLVRDPEGPVVGVVSERDIFHVQQMGITQVFAPIDAASNVDEVVELAKSAQKFTQRVFRQGMEVSQFTRLVSSINDRVVARLLAIIDCSHGIGRDYCWLAFGSEGREEQGFVTDQDNGIIFAPGPSEDVETVRAGYLDMARQMNNALHRCGFELCKGNIMAGNPEWCLTVNEWNNKFSRWIRSPTPDALLNATIFFDFRGVHGDMELVEHLHNHLRDEIRGNTICLSMLAAIALSVAPPLGKWKRFITDVGDNRGTFDLKVRGSRLFVDAARIFALAAGVRTANTERRLRAVGKLMKRAPTTIEGDVAAFRFIQTIRLRRQLDSLTDGRSANRVDPYLLNDLDQRMLIESLRQVQSLQQRLKLDYSR